MSLRGRHVTEINEADLQRLITDRVRESQTLEYKRECYGRNDDQVREMLRDISALANAFGGDLLIGVEEDEDGTAVNLPGVENAEEESRRIVSSCLSNIEERMPGLATFPVSLSNGRHVIVVRIPRSLRSPHMVTFRGLNQFWVRHDRQKSPMSIHEIKEACLRVEGLMEKLESFLEKRKVAIRKKIGDLSYYIVSLTPVFVDAEIVDIRDSHLREILADPPGQRNRGWSVSFGRRPNPTLHGLEIELADWKAVELFRNGHMELRVRIEESSFCQYKMRVDEELYPVLHAYPLVEYPVSLLRLAKEAYSYLGLTDPATFSLTIFNISGFALARYPNHEASGIPLAHYGPRLWTETENDLEVGPRQIPSLEEPDKVAREFVDRIWQAFGYENAPLFDAEGNFTPG